ncbi:MAG: DUF5672 family protein [Candidatus Thorarchaeota archaeon]|jgi:hypothetical protein
MMSITLVAVETRPDFIECVDALLRYQLDIFEFSDVLYFNNNPTKSYHKFLDIETPEDYSDFIIWDLHNQITTDFVLVTQWDGFILNPRAWNKEFLDYDYIGAPWLDEPCETSLKVGNGGFSLRSQKLLREASKLPKVRIRTEDTYICRTYGKQMRKQGIKFPDLVTAFKFSVENRIYKGQFGFHGPLTIKMNPALFESHREFIEKNYYDKK